MAIFMFGGQKGGSGKSTIAVNLAASLVHKKLDMVLVDTDPQGTSSKWVSRRNSKIEQSQTSKAISLPVINCVQRTGDIRNTIQDLAKRYQHVIIDAGGNDDEAQRTGMVVADVMFIPLKASQADLETLSHMCNLISAAKSFNNKLKAFAVLSMLPTNPTIKEATHAENLLLDFKEHIKLSCIYISERKVYRDTLLEGLGVIESNNQRAIEEVRILTIEAMKVGQNAKKKR